MYSEQPKNSGGLLVVVIATLVFGGLIAGRFLIFELRARSAAGATPPVSANISDPGSSQSAGRNGAVNDSGTGPVEVLLLTSDTKAEWLHTVTDPFNAAGHTTASGRLIHVTVQGHGSPGQSQQRLIDGQLQPTLWSPGDISWVDTANQVVRDLGQPPLVSETCPRLVYAATGFAMWRPKAEALGWPDTPIGWRTLVDLAADPQGWAAYGHPEWGQFKFGHTHPAHSTTGFSMLATLAYAALDRTDGLTPELVKSAPVVEAFRTVELNTYHYGTSTRSISVLMAQRGPSYLHAITSSETSVLATNHYQADVMRFPYVFIFPAEGTFWSDNPACLVDRDWVSPDQREAAQIYRDYLLAPQQQDAAVTIGLRPANPQVALHDPISLPFGTDPRVSPQSVPPLETVSGPTAQAIIDTFELTKKKATIVLLLDTSGSMIGTKIRSAASGSHQFLQALADEDIIALYQFNDQLEHMGRTGPAAVVLEDLTRALAGIEAGGFTVLHEAVCAAVHEAERLKSADAAAGMRRLYGVVLLSDGADNGSELTEAELFACLPKGEDAEGIKIFTIAYGEDADQDLLARVAEQTNGRLFTADPESLDQVYLAISAEQ